MDSEFNSILNYRGIVFDLDGTLIDSMKFHIKAWQIVGEENGITIPTEYLMAHGGVPSHNIAREIIKIYDLALKDPLELAQRKTLYYKSFISKIHIYPMAERLLKFAAKHNIKMSIATGTIKSNVDAIMKSNDLEKYICAIVTSEDVTNHKPSPDTFLKAVELMGLSSKECIVFEDAPLGILAAKNGGFDCCVVKDGVFNLGCIINN